MKKIITFFLSMWLLTSSFLPTQADEYITSLFIALDNGGPITTEQHIRLSLWSDGRYRDGDLSSGIINTSAPYYANYQIVLTRTPDSEGRLNISFGDLTALPEITPQNQFMMIEYKNSADPDTSYVIYSDSYIDQSNIDRFPLVINGPSIYNESYENDATTADNFLIDFDDSGADIGIQFGKTLAESLIWDDSENYFLLSDSLVVDGNINLLGTTLRLDFDETGNPDQDIDIVALQGSESSGIIRYDDGSNIWTLSNNGGSFFEILTAGYIIPIVQASRSTTFAIGTSYQDVNFDVTNVENDSSKLDHDAGTNDRIYIYEDGTYIVSYNANVQLTSILLAGASVDARVRTNDSTTITGSTSSLSIPLNVGSFTFVVNRSVAVTLNNGDFISFQMQRGGNAATLQADALFSIQRVGGL